MSLQNLDILINKWKLKVQNNKVSNNIILPCDTINYWPEWQLFGMADTTPCMGTLMTTNHGNKIKVEVLSFSE